MQIYFISFRFCSCENFQLYNERLVFFRCMNLELQLHIKVGYRAILQTKPCTSLNLVRLITAKVTHTKFLGMSYYQASSNPRICFVFYNNAPQSKAVAVKNKRKIFSFLTRPSWSLTNKFSTIFLSLLFHILLSRLHYCSKKKET